MRNVRLISVARAALATALLLATAGDALAQAQGAGQQPAGAQGTYVGPGVKGQMGSTKNDERWAAAARKADQRADHIRKHGKGK